MYSLILVDDEETVLENMQKVFSFEDYGFAVAGVFSNPLEALESLQKLRPHLIITDIRMPQMDGLEFAAGARTQLPDVEIVVLSGYDDFLYAQSAMRLGVSDYLLKPIRKSDYAKMLRKMQKKLDDQRQQENYLETLEKMAKIAQSPEQSEQKIKRQKVQFSQNVMDAIAFIGEHYTENISLGDVAEHTHISKNYLSDLFRKELDTSFGTYLASVRMSRAKQLLAETDKKMYEISEEVGYNDYAYFSTQFKKYTGRTLSEYRQEHMA